MVLNHFHPDLVSRLSICTVFAVGSVLPFQVDEIVIYLRRPGPVLNGAVLHGLHPDFVSRKSFSASFALRPLRQLHFNVGAGNHCDCAENNNECFD